MGALPAAARAAIAEAIANQETADYARGLVGDAAAELPPGARIKAQRRLRAFALHGLDLAVIHERALGATWAQIADALHLPVVEVLARYEDAYERWASDPAGTVDAWCIAPGGRADTDPEGTAAAVDAWYQRHAEPWEPTGQKPVTSALR